MCVSGSNIQLKKEFRRAPQWALPEGREIGWTEIVLEHAHLVFSQATLPSLRRWIRAGGARIYKVEGIGAVEYGVRHHLPHAYGGYLLHDVSQALGVLDVDGV